MVRLSVVRLSVVRLSVTYSLDNEEVLAQWGLLCHGEEVAITVNAYAVRLLLLQ